MFPDPSTTIVEVQQKSEFVTEHNMTPLFLQSIACVVFPIQTTLALMVIERDPNCGYSCMKASSILSISDGLSRNS
jgi:hypothetical protein